MSPNKDDDRVIADLRDIYVSAAKSVSAANRELEDSDDPITYAVVESDVSIPYLNLVTRGGNLCLRLPEANDLDQAMARVSLKIKPIPKLEAEEPVTEESPIKVPNVAKLPLDVALSTLYEAGLRVGKVLYATKAGPRGIISTQSPTAGASVDIGSAVDLQVAGEPLKIDIPPEKIKPVVAAKDTKVTKSKPANKATKRKKR